MIGCSRRSALLGAGATFAVAACQHSGTESAGFISSIERELKGRIGFVCLDAESGRRIHHRADERFAMCSTFKAPLAAAVLTRIDRGSINPDEHLRLEPGRLLPVSPVSSTYAISGAMPILAACEAIVTHSDNTAANLLLARIGGPLEMTSYFREVGDTTSRIDRFEMDLNTNVEGDLRDSTTPGAIANTLSKIVLGSALAPAMRALLIEWMINEQRGGSRTRAGLPTGWRVANKPGTSANGATNDIAVAWTPAAKPLVFASFVNAPKASGYEREAAIAEIVRMSTNVLMRSGS